MGAPDGSGQPHSPWPPKSPSETTKRLVPANCFCWAAVGSAAVADESENEVVQARVNSPVVLEPWTVSAGVSSWATVLALPPKAPRTWCSTFPEGFEEHYLQGRACVEVVDLVCVQRVESAGPFGGDEEVQRRSVTVVLALPQVAAGRWCEVELTNDVRRIHGEIIGTAELSIGCHWGVVLRPRERHG